METSKVQRSPSEVGRQSGMGLDPRKGPEQMEARETRAGEERTARRAGGGGTKEHLRRWGGAGKKPGL